MSGVPYCANCGHIIDHPAIESLRTESAAKDATIAVLREELETAREVIRAAGGAVSDACGQRPAWTDKHKCALVYGTMVDTSKADDRIEKVLAATPEANRRAIQAEGMRLLSKSPALGSASKTWISAFADQHEKGKA